LVEFDLFRPISLEFPPEVVLFPPEVGLDQLIFQNFQGFTRFVAKSFENWPFSLEKNPPGPPNQKYKAFIAFLCDNIFKFQAK
jgi:hypothetical protein